MELSEKIKLLRNKRLWSQTELATAAGVPQPTICRLENGHVKQPKIQTLFRIARALGVSSDDLASQDVIVRIRPTSDVVKLRIVVK
ncbi:hypothetical protein ES703_68699 [subsurface metagenome]